MNLWTIITKSISHYSILENRNISTKMQKKMFWVPSNSTVGCFSLSYKNQIQYVTLGNVIVYFWPFFLTFVDKNIINELGKWSKMAVGRSNPGIISYPMCIYVASSSLRVLGLNNLACGVRKNRCVSMYRCCSLRYSRNHPHATYCIYEDQCRHPH